MAFACDSGAGGYPYGEIFTAGACNDSTSGTNVEPTASHPNCCNPVDGGVDLVCDLSGNAAEVVWSPIQGVFGGSTETSDSALLACGTDALGSTATSYRGFRCCAVPSQ